MATQSSVRCLENSMDRGAWQDTDHGVAKGQTQLSREGLPSQASLCFSAASAPQFPHL